MDARIQTYPAPTSQSPRWDSSDFRHDSRLRVVNNGSSVSNAVDLIFFFLFFFVIPFPERRTSHPGIANFDSIVTLVSFTLLVRVRASSVIILFPLTGFFSSLSLS